MGGLLRGRGLSASGAEILRREGGILAVDLQEIPRDAEILFPEVARGG